MVLHKMIPHSKKFRMYLDVSLSWSLQGTLSHANSSKILRQQPHLRLFKTLFPRFIYLFPKHLFLAMYHLTVSFPHNVFWGMLV